MLVSLNTIIQGTTRPLSGYPESPDQFVELLAQVIDLLAKVCTFSGFQYRLLTQPSHGARPLIDLHREPMLILGCIDDGLVHRFNLFDDLDHVGQATACIPSPHNGDIRIAPAALHEFCGLFGALLHTLYHPGDVEDALLRARGERANFVCDNGKASAMLTSPGRLYGGIQGQQIGFLRCC